MVLVQPVVTVEEEELLAPEHAGEGLAHHLGRVFTHRWRRDRLVKLIGFTKPVSEDFIKLLSEGFALLVRRIVGEPQANHFGLTGADIDLVVRRDLGALLFRVHRALIALHHAVVDAVLDVGALVLLPGKSRSWFVSFSVKSSGTSPSQERMNSPSSGCAAATAARARSCLDLLEVRFLGSPV